MCMLAHQLVRFPLEDKWKLVLYESVKTAYTIRYQATIASMSHILQDTSSIL